MSTFVFLAGLTLIAAVLMVFLKESRMPVFALLVGLFAGVLIFLRILPQLSQVIDVFWQLSDLAALNSAYLSLLLKIIAICYLTEFVSELCRDAQQNGLAVKLEMGAKVLIMVMSTPILFSILDSVLELLP